MKMTVSSTADPNIQEEEEELIEEEEAEFTRPNSAFLTVDPTFDELDRSFAAQEEEDRQIQTKISKLKQNLDDILEITLHPDDHIFTPRSETANSENTTELWDELNSAPDSPISSDVPRRASSAKPEYHTPEFQSAQVPQRPYSTNAKRSKKFWDITSAKANEKRAQSASFHQRKFIAAKDLALKLDKVHMQNLQDDIYEQEYETSSIASTPSLDFEKDTEKNDQIIQEFNAMNNYKQAEKSASPIGSSTQQVRVVFPNANQQKLAQKTLLKRRNSTFD